MTHLLNRLLLLVLLLNLGCEYAAQDHALNAPAGMAFIPNGSFDMGGKSAAAEADEFPVARVQVSAFYLDETEVTNTQYLLFAEATNYLTVAERAIDWEEMKKSLPGDVPKPPDSLLQAGSLVFKATQSAVNLADYSQWWEWKIGANWREPEGPGSSISKRMNHPVVHIAYEDAQAYAKWAGKRLPTETEWEWASMGGVEDAVYPWGNAAVEHANDKANFWQGIFPFKNYLSDGFYGTSPVKSFPANGYGLFDMAGNVWELCYDKYHVNAYRMRTESTDPVGPSQSYDPREPHIEKYVSRGGSFLCNDSYCSGYRSARRMSVAKDSGLNHTGFRCAKSLD